MREVGNVGTDRFGIPEATSWMVFLGVIPTALMLTHGNQLQCIEMGAGVVFWGPSQSALHPTTFHPGKKEEAPPIQKSRGTENPTFHG